MSLLTDLDSSYMKEKQSGHSSGSNRTWNIGAHKWVVTG